MKFLDLFAGIGGFSLGLERAGMQCVGQVEIDGFCNQVLEKHWPHVKRLHDIREVKGDEFGTVELVCGGFPCQPFSTAGKRRGHADDRYLWPEMLRVIQASRPRWVCGENVAGIVSMALDTVLSDLEASGYACQALIIPACAVDAPHRRDRVWIVGHSIESGLEGLSWNGSSSDEPGRLTAETVGSVGASSVCETMAHTQGHAERPGLCDTGSPTIGRRKFGNGGADVADTVNNGSYRAPRNAAFTGGNESQNGLSVGNGRPQGAIWEPEPDVGRVAHGVSGRVDRLRALGNAVVPQVVTEIGRAIMQAERREDSQNAT